MIRASVLFDQEPEPERYKRHLDDFVSTVPCDAFRQGRAFGSPFGEPAFKHYAEFEWTDRESFEAATQSQEFLATGKDAMDMGIPFTVIFVELA